MAIATYTKAGAKATVAAKLDKSVFEVEAKNHELLKQAYHTYLANGRENLSKTLRRGEVRGGGKKPWKQKGTGRARFGSIRVPIWRGGGITFGPLGIENYSKKLNGPAKRTAIRQALTLKSQAGGIIVIDDIQVKDGKTSAAIALLKKIGANGRVLIAVENKTPELVRAFNNIQKTDITQASYLNTYSIMNADTLIITTKALDRVHEWLSKKSVSAKSDAKASVKPATKTATKSATKSAAKSAAKPVTKTAAKTASKAKEGTK
ncbi:MAG: large subunit ribosomal protein L4 [Candidatus Saccharimonadales bacterium]|jgi:large subunit ribosomal protein L4